MSQTKNPLPCAASPESGPSVGSCGKKLGYARALSDELVLEQPPRTQQLLGWYTRVITSLDEYYCPAKERALPGEAGVSRARTPIRSGQ
jgi:ectoine hydroxylase-related dioxygenase (phytanoyl-CoA dioxygenase family)